MTFMDPYLRNEDKLNLLCRWIIFHSILYYERDKSVVSDEMFDNNCKQLTRGIRKDPAAFKRCKWYDVMYDFDGSTGFDLPGRLNKDQRILIERDIEMLLRRNRDAKTHNR